MTDEFLIQATGLTRQYKMGTATVEALAGIDLQVRAGEFIALMGPSGSGKSTILNIIGGLDRPTSGEIWVNGTELSKAGEKALVAHRRNRVAFIFQSFNLLPRLTALENVELPLVLAGVNPRERRERSISALQQVGLTERLNHKPTELSGGEQQRVAIARALVAKPVILLADEPTGNLDSARGAEIMGVLRNLNRNRGLTLLVVTHDPEVAGYADRTIRLRDGRILPSEAG